MELFWGGAWEAGRPRPLQGPGRFRPSDHRTQLLAGPFRSPSLPIGTPFKGIGSGKYNNES